MKMRSLTARRQRGAVLVFAAMAISALIIGLSLIELGLLYQYRREYQKTVDLAALAGAQHLRDGCAAATAAANQAVALNIGGRNHGAPTVSCGDWRPATASFDPAAPDHRAVEVTISGAPPALLPFIGNRTLSARAIAVADRPLAALSLRSSLVAIDTAQSAVLNGLMSGVLGGSINLTAGSWTGLLNTDISLLQFMDALAVRLGVEAGNRAALLASQARVGDLVEAAIDVLQAGGGTGEVGASLAGLQALSLGIPALSPPLLVGDLLKLETGGDDLGLATALNLLELIRASAQLAGADALVDLPATALPGIATVNLRVQTRNVGRPLAVGDPELAATDPQGPNGIRVSSSNVRALVSLELPVIGSTLNAIQGLLSNDALVGITNTVNSLLNLDLLGLIQSLTCVIACDIQRDVTDVQVLPTPRVDLLVEAGQGSAYVEGHRCSGSKSLEVPTQTSAAQVRIGRYGATAAEAASLAFSGTALPAPEPVPLLDIGHYRARHQCTLLLICSTTWRRADGSWTSNKAEAQRIAFSGGGIGIRLGSGDSGAVVGGTTSALSFSEPPTGGLPEFGEAPHWQTISSNANLINSLSNTVNGLGLIYYQPSNGNVLGNVLALTGGVVSPLVDALEGLIESTLDPLLGPLVNNVLATLGATLAQTEVGANLSCEGGGATLVR